MKPFHTTRLTLRELETGDAAFILRLLNEPGWLRFIGDRGIRTLAAAEDYLREGPQRMYRQHGLGLWLVERRDGGVPVGICGLLQRDNLADVDLGFAFLSEHWRQGYAYESAAATMAYGRDVLGLARLVAIATPDNEASIRLLEKLAFRFESTIRLKDDAPPVSLYATYLRATK